jgi:TPR repeat protein
MSGVEQDVDVAFSSFDLAAQQGDASVMNNLGNMYEKGWGADPDREKALELYAKGAQFGNQLARDNLQRFKATTSESGRQILSMPPSRAHAIPMNDDVPLSPGEPTAVSITERDTI